MSEPLSFLPEHLPLPESFFEGVADDLAQNGWSLAHRSQWLSDALIDALTEESVRLERDGAMARAGVGRGGQKKTDSGIRRDRIVWIDEQSEAQRQLCIELERCRQALNSLLFLNLKRFEAHFASYQPGDFYRRHLDSFAGRASRIVSVVIYLNADWQADEGGELAVYERDDPQAQPALVLPDRNTMVFMLSEEIPHEVLPATRARHSIACWFRQDDFTAGLV